MLEESFPRTTRELSYVQYKLHSWGMFGRHPFFFWSIQYNHVGWMDVFLIKVFIGWGKDARENVIVVCHLRMEGVSFVLL